MNLLKRLLFKIFGVKAYLSIISTLFFISYKLNLLKGKNEFYCHYFVKKLINEDDVVIDLGANLGYYSVIFSKLVGKNGNVHSIEPVQLFRSVLERNIKGKKNINIIPFAIGENENEKIKMGVPVSSSYFSHGRTHVLSDNEDCTMVFNATIKKPDSIFKDLSKLDYIKCDIEGYEIIAIPLFENLLTKFKPILQIEIGKENQDQLVAYLRGLNYNVFEVIGEKIHQLNGSTHNAFGDFIFIPSEKIENYDMLIAK